MGDNPARRAALSSTQLSWFLSEGIADQAFVTLDVDGRITSWSKGAERILLHSEAEVLGSPGEILFTGEDRARGVPSQELETARREGRADDERWHVRKDGSRFWAWDVMTAIRDAADRPMGFAKVMRDLTGQRLADAALRFVENEREYALFETDPAGRISSWPTGAERLFGYTGEEIMGQPTARLFVAEEAGGFSEHARRMARKDGSGFRGRCVAEPIRDENGKLCGTAWILREESVRGNADEAANLAPALLWRTDAGGQVEWHNQRWRDYTGRALDDFDWSGVIDPHDRPEAQREFREALRSGRPFRHEHRLRRHDGIYRWFLARAEPVRDDTGRILHWFGAATDIEEQRLALTIHEEERRRIARELCDSVGPQLEAAQALTQSSGQAADSRRMRILEELDERIGKLAQQIRELSDGLHPHILEVSGLPAALRHHAGEFGRGRRVPVELALDDLAPGGPLPVATAAYRIAQEALRNACRHAAADCRIRIVLTSLDRALQLTISDTGPGFRVDLASAEEGSGIVSMRERARLAGGTLEIDSTPEGGTTVDLRLPWGASVSRQAKPRILIADDHDATRYILRRFAEAECEVVAEVGNGLEAVRTAETLRPELVVLDVSMPVMGGVDAARLIHERFPEIRIIFASQHTAREYADEAFRAGAQGYIVKQAMASELAAAIRDVLAGKSFRSPLIRVEGPLD